ncbi:MAG: hypothetical protein OHK0046_47870 [Anaerolineae bacterium]
MSEYDPRLGRFPCVPVPVPVPVTVSDESGSQMNSELILDIRAAMREFGIDDSHLPDETILESVNIDELKRTLNHLDMTAQEAARLAMGIHALLLGEMRQIIKSIEGNPSYATLLEERGLTVGSFVNVYMDNHDVLVGRIYRIEGNYAWITRATGVAKVPLAYCASIEQMRHRAAFWEKHGEHEY